MLTPRQPFKGKHTLYKAGQAVQGLALQRVLGSQPDTVQDADKTA